MRNAVLSNTNVAYRSTGQGQITVFIMQSLGFASAEWWPLQDDLSGHARVLTWDRPGYGESGPPLSPRTVGNIAAEGLELLSRVQDGRESSQHPLADARLSGGGQGDPSADTRLAPTRLWPPR